ncbi:hypothetical protein SUGI_0535770 [Cryptomeria japonica]|nr:hypothetical protein SUGI_0535770 [Cryptomeria japonica]
MWSVFDLVGCAVENIPSCTRNIPLMLIQLSHFVRRIYSCVLRTASDMRDTYIWEDYMQHQTLSGGYVNVSISHWSNPSAACYIH